MIYENAFAALPFFYFVFEFYLFTLGRGLQYISFMEDFSSANMKMQLYYFQFEKILENQELFKLSMSKLGSNEEVIYALKCDNVNRDIGEHISTLLQG